MKLNFKVQPLIEQFEDPIYPVLVENIPQGSRLVSAVVIFEHDRMNGKFNFGDLTPIINHWPTVMINTLKAEIRNAIFNN